MYRTQKAAIASFQDRNFRVVQFLGTDIKEDLVSNSFLLHILKVCMIILNHLDWPRDWFWVYR